MVRRWFILFLTALTLHATAQEVLLPLQRSVTVPRMAQKEAATAVTLPFFDDFATSTSGLWQDNGGATVTYDVSPLAPTVGVLTLDALGNDGVLYSHAATQLFPADTLTSLPLRLDSLAPADSVVLSFFYLPGGGFGNMWERVGDAPDAQDSLFVDFYSAQDDEWVNVWCHGGISVDTLVARTGTDWQYVTLPLDDSRWFDSLFRFRFRNYASLESTPKAGRAGNCDYWHLDYVMVDRGRDVATPHASRDVAFAAPAPSLLQHYRAMPYRQYTPQALAGNIDISIINRFNSPLASHYTYSVYDTVGTEISSYDGGFENAPPQTLQTIATHCRPSVSNTVTLPAMTAPTEFLVVHVVQEGTSGDAYPLNDTVRYCQRFGEYYAYDDGTPENGYGLTSTAARLYLAYRFDLTTADTLTAIDMFFNRTLDDGNASIPFYLTLWSVGDEGKPSSVLYKDEARRLAAFDGFTRYVLETPTVVEGSIFVGFEQIGNDYINLGFDRSFNTADRIWYLTGTEWQQSILSGSLMLRPCFGVNATVGIVESQPIADKVSVWPNPANEQLYLEGLAEGSMIHLYDIMGRRVLSSRQSPIDTSPLPNGLYLLHAVTPSGAVHTTKIIIKH